MLLGASVPSNTVLCVWPWTGLGKEDEGKEEGCLPSVMLTQTKKQTFKAKLAEYKTHAAKIAAIIHIINTYERQDDPIKIRPYAESARA